MIDGITILSQETIYEYIYDYSYIFWGALIAMVVGFLIFFIITQDVGGSVGIGLLCSFLGTLIGILVVEGTVEEIPTDRNQYKVLIEDSVQMSEFYGHYEVVEQDGEIWIIQDKEIKK